MKHLWTYESICHHCGCDGVEVHEGVKQGYTRAELGGIHCPDGTRPNTKPLPVAPSDPEDDDWYWINDEDSQAASTFC